MKPANEDDISNNNSLHFTDDTSTNEIADWLKTLKLSHYEHLLSKFNSLQEIKLLKEDEIFDLGIHRFSERNSLLSGIELLNKDTDSNVIPSYTHKTSFNNNTITRLNREESKRDSYEELSNIVPSQNKLNVTFNEKEDLSIYDWYRGEITRQNGEILCKEDGDFIVRDSISSPGDYVLTVKKSEQTLHFVLNRESTNNGDQFRLEGDAYKKVSLLIKDYTQRRIVLSETSQAIIVNPATTSNDQQVPVMKSAPIITPKSILRSGSSASSSSAAASLPSKPSRVPTIAKSDHRTRPLIVKRYESDPDANDYGDSCGAWQALEEQQDYDVPNPLASSADTCVNQRPLDVSYYKYDRDSYLLCKDTKPLDPSSMDHIHKLFVQGNADEFARHLTLIDLDMLRITDGEVTINNHVTTSGYELITLPEGEHLRNDIIHRYDVLMLFIQTTVLSLHNSADRLQVIRWWVTVADSLITDLGNLYTFACVIDALQAQRIQDLTLAWSKFEGQSDSLFTTYKTRLLSSRKQQKEASVSLPLGHGVIIPEVIYNISCILNAVQSEEMDISLQLTHMDTMRIVSEHSSYFSRNAFLELSQFIAESLYLDISRTETQCKLLWGAKTISSVDFSGSDRMALFVKFNMVLDALKNRCQATGAD